jgi:hypothetical protein
MRSSRRAVAGRGAPSGLPSSLRPAASRFQVAHAESACQLVATGELLGELDELLIGLAAFVPNELFEHRTRGRT